MISIYYPSNGVLALNSFNIMEILKTFLASQINPFYYANTIFCFLLLCFKRGIQQLFTRPMYPWRERVAMVPFYPSTCVMRRCGTKDTVCYDGEVGSRGICLGYKLSHSNLYSSDAPLVPNLPSIQPSREREVFG